MGRKDIAQIEREKILLGPVRTAYHPEVRRLCLRPYFNHPYGCPNYGRRPDCPPQAEYFPDVFKDEVYIAAIVFNFKDYLEIKKARHPDWQERALRNPRHWQGHLRSELKKFISEEVLNGKEQEAVFNPEAMGVDVNQTCRAVGLKLEWPPQRRVCQVALIAKRKECA